MEGAGRGKSGGETCGAPCLWKPRGCVLAATACALPSTHGLERGEMAQKAQNPAWKCGLYPRVLWSAPGRKARLRGQQKRNARCEVVPAPRIRWRGAG